jgi:hypothetical protein
MDKIDSLAIKKKSSKSHSGYAYSAAPGHDKLVTDSLTNRLKEALAQRMF